MTRADVVYLCFTLAGWALLWASHNVSGPWRGLLSVPLFIWSIAMVIQLIRKQHERDQPAVMHLDSK
jgi:hypothetical protein